MPKRRKATASSGNRPKRSKRHDEKAAGVKEMDRLAWAGSCGTWPQLSLNANEIVRPIVVNVYAAVRCQ